MVTSPTINPTSKHKAISALLPHAISLEQSGDQEMLNAIFHVARVSNPWLFVRRFIGPNIVALLSKPAPSLNQITTLLAPHIPYSSWDETMVSRWTVAVSAVPYSEEVGWSVVDTLLQLASSATLRSHIPIEIWTWLERLPSLPPVCKGRDGGTRGDLVCHVQGLGDLNILTSYLLLVWSEWDALDDSGFAKMQVLIAEDLSEFEMQHYRKDLIKRLDHILGEVNRGLKHLRQHKWWIKESGIQKRKQQYRKLREVLLEVDQTTEKNVAGMSQVDLFQKTY